MELLGSEVKGPVLVAVDRLFHHELSANRVVAPRRKVNVMRSMSRRDTFVGNERK